MYQYNLRMCFEVSISFEEEYIKTIQRETNLIVRSRTQFYSLKFKERNLLLSRSKCYIKSRCPRKENNIFYLGANGLVWVLQPVTSETKLFYKGVYIRLKLRLKFIFGCLCVACKEFISDDQSRCLLSSRKTNKSLPVCISFSRVFAIPKYGLLKNTRFASWKANWCLYKLSTNERRGKD